jgi:hypothetical protein
LHRILNPHCRSLHGPVDDAVARSTSQPPFPIIAGEPITAPNRHCSQLPRSHQRFRSRLVSLVLHLLPLFLPHRARRNTCSAPILSSRASSPASRAPIDFSRGLLRFLSPKPYQITSFPSSRALSPRHLHHGRHGGSEGRPRYVRFGNIYCTSVHAGR